MHIPSLNVLTDSKHLATGGFATVHTARHKDKPVVVKWPLRKDPYEEKTFKAEMEVLAGLQHENVVKLEAVYISKDPKAVPALAIVLEYVDGGDLKNRQKDAVFRSAGQQKCSILQQIAAGLEAIHAAGLVHRDIKPANVLLTKQNAVRICDLGLARYVKGNGLLTVTHGQGTPHYCAPEQWDEKSAKIGTAADVYAFGGLIYWMVTGQDPWHGLTLPQISVKIAKQERPAVAKPPVWCPADLLTLMHECWAQAPAARPPISQVAMRLHDIYDNAFGFLNNALDQPCVSGSLVSLPSVMDWTVDDVVTWMTELNNGAFAAFAPAFAKEQVTGPVLLRLDGPALADLGFPASLLQSRFLAAIDQIRPPSK
jgi:serine/threonine protein kinase